VAGIFAYNGNVTAELQSEKRFYIAFMAIPRVYHGCRTVALGICNIDRHFDTRTAGVSPFSVGIDLWAVDT
jgi:hypothetical protein